MNLEAEVNSKASFSDFPDDSPHDFEDSDKEEYE